MVIGQIVLGAKLGEGAFGKVFKAAWQGSRVAAKIHFRDFDVTIITNVIDIFLNIMRLLLFLSVNVTFASFMIISHSFIYCRVLLMLTYSFSC